MNRRKRHKGSEDHLNLMTVLPIAHQSAHCTKKWSDIYPMKDKIMIGQVKTDFIPQRRC